MSVNTGLCTFDASRTISSVTVRTGDCDRVQVRIVSGSGTSLHTVSGERRTAVLSVQPGTTSVSARAVEGGVASPWYPVGGFAIA